MEGHLVIRFVQPLVSLMWSDQARYITTSLRSFLMDLLGKGSPFIHDNFARADMVTGIIPVDLLFSDVSKKSWRKYELFAGITVWNDFKRNYKWTLEWTSVVYYISAYEEKQTIPNLSCTDIVVTGILHSDSVPVLSGNGSNSC